MKIPAAFLIANYLKDILSHLKMRGWDAKKWRIEELVDCLQFVDDEKQLVRLGGGNSNRRAGSIEFSVGARNLLSGRIRFDFTELLPKVGQPPFFQELLGCGGIGISGFRTDLERFAPVSSLRSRGRDGTARPKTGGPLGSTCSVFSRSAAARRFGGAEPSSLAQAPRENGT